MWLLVVLLLLMPLLAHAAARAAGTRTSGLGRLEWRLGLCSPVLGSHLPPATSLSTVSLHTDLAYWELHIGGWAGQEEDHLARLIDLQQFYSVCALATTWLANCT